VIGQPGGEVVTADAIVDHLLLGVADLDRGIEWLELRAGTRAAIGGSHPGRGTRNALLSLGERKYLEIIAPDPAQQGAQSWLPNLGSLAQPRLVWWAAAASDVQSLSHSIREQGLETLGPYAGSRARPEGGVLTWTTLAVTTSLARNDVDPAPFFIEWAPGTVHPSVDAPLGGRLVTLEFEHPEPERLAVTLKKIGIDAVVNPSATARIVATLDTPKGPIVLA
jgi:hypothetical protein